MADLVLLPDEPYVFTADDEPGEITVATRGLKVVSEEGDVQAGLAAAAAIGFDFTGALFGRSAILYIVNVPFISKRKWRGISQTKARMTMTMMSYCQVARSKVQKNPFQSMRTGSGARVRAAPASWSHAWRSGSCRPIA